MHQEQRVDAAQTGARLQEVAPPPEIDIRGAAGLLQMAWRQGRNNFPCYTGPTRNVQDGGTIVHRESFTAMVIADLLIGQREHGALVRSIGSMLERELTDDDVFHFFKEHERLPADADCTALGLSVMLRNGARVRDQAHRALDRILANADEHGVVETYFDPSGDRSGIVDPVVCANVLFLAFQLGREDEAQATLEYVHRVLMEKVYLDGTRYYHSPDSFLYFLGRVVHHFPQTHDLLLEPLKEAVRERQGVSSYVIDVAQRVLLCAWFDLDDGGELRTLAELQGGTGTWAADALFRYGRKKIYFGGRVLGTAFAMTAAVHGRNRAAAPVSAPAPAPAPAPVIEHVVPESSAENVTYVNFGR